MKDKFKEGFYRFYRTKTFLMDDKVDVYTKEGGEEYFITSIRPEEMEKKGLDFYKDSDIIKFKKTYR
jgi:hypothetical protein